MRQVIIIHGLPDKDEYYGGVWPSPSNSHWIPWIQKQLNKKDFSSQALEMPKPFFPNYEEWSDVFSQMKISHETILIGHSCGAGFLVRYLSENISISPKQVILVAPWIDTDNYLRDQENTFFDFKIDSDISNRTEVHIMVSSDDDQYIHDSVDSINSSISRIIMHKFTDKGHFTEPGLGSKEFPELLEILT